MPVKLTSDGKGFEDWLRQSGVMTKTRVIRNNVKGRGGCLLSLDEFREFIFSLRVYSKPLWRCAYCHLLMQLLDPEFTVDHDLPVSLGGTGTKENLRPACKRCNTRKGKLDRESYQRLRATVEEFPVEMQSDFWRRLSQKPQWGNRKKVEAK